MNFKNIIYLIFLASHNIPAGVLWQDNIKKALLDCHELFLLLSTDSINSQWVIAECTSAWVLDKQIIPILLHNITSKQLPQILSNINAVEFFKLEQIIKDFLERRSRRVVRNPKVLLFDIDGTILKQYESLDDRTPDGIQLIHIFKNIAERSAYLVFITGNDYQIQYDRFLKKIINHGLGPSSFCFSDGGTRAFEFNDDTNNFEELRNYSDENLISDHDKGEILNAFRNELRIFIRRNRVLAKPDVLEYNRTLDYIELIVRPIKPSFYKDSGVRYNYNALCDKIDNFIQDILGGAAIPYKLIKDISNVLIARIYKKEISGDIVALINKINDLWVQNGFKRISEPEEDVRGGLVTCQIALKPFKDDKLRKLFRKTMEDRLSGSLTTKFSVLLGGKTTIDIQREGVNKAKAVKFIADYKQFRASQMIYFGDEFGPFGNDLSVALMPDQTRPVVIVNVGKEKPDDPNVINKLINDCNGPTGTLNYLRFLLG